jgi:hypothetical protein
MSFNASDHPAALEPMLELSCWTVASTFKTCRPLRLDIEVAQQERDHPRHAMPLELDTWHIEKS